MPEKEEMEQLLDELKEPEAPTATITEEGEPAEPEEPTTDPVEPPTEEVPPAPKEAPKEDPKARAFAEMRAKNTQYERALKKAAEVEGISVEEYLKKIDEGATTKRAEQMQTSPEILRRLEEAESKLAEQEQSKVQMHLAMEFQKLQQTLSVSDDELAAFTEKLASKGFNFMDPSADYTALYRGLNYEKLVEKERQEWLARSQKASQQGSQPLTKTGKNGSTSPATIETMAELDALLEGL